MLFSVWTKSKEKSFVLCTSQVVHQSGFYPCFSSMKWLGIFLLPPGWDARVTSSIKFAGTHLHSWVERGAARVKCLAQEHNQSPRQGLEPTLLDPDATAQSEKPLVSQFALIMGHRLSLHASQRATVCSLHSTSQSAIYIADRLPSGFVLSSS